jgi:hypothetical protein
MTIESVLSLNTCIPAKDHVKFKERSDIVN